MIKENKKREIKYAGDQKLKIVRLPNQVSKMTAKIQAFVWIECSQ